MKKMMMIKKIEKCREKKMKCAEQQKKIIQNKKQTLEGKKSKRNQGKKITFHLIY